MGARAAPRAAMRNLATAASRAPVRRPPTVLGRRTLAEAITVQAPLRTGANAALPPPTRPYGAASSGVIGLLLGSLVVAAYGSRVLLDRYEVASAALQESVEALRSSTEQVRSELSEELAARDESRARLARFELPITHAPARSFGPACRPP